MTKMRACTWNEFATSRVKVAGNSPAVTLVLGLLILTSTPVTATPTARSTDGEGMGFIEIAGDNWTFIDAATGELFVPFGTNYYDPETGWPPQLWKQFDPERVDYHFALMKQLKVNVARVFLTAASFQPERLTVSEEALDKLDRMIEIARRHGIRLILTGPDHWEGVPAYWSPDRFAHEIALGALDHFWTVVAGRYKDEPVIMAWDLLNEPMIPWESPTMAAQWSAWVREQYSSAGELARAWGEESARVEWEWGHFRIPQNRGDEGNPRLYDYQRFRESIARRWVERQVQAIRAVDPNHLITLGMIQWSFPYSRATWEPDPLAPSWYSAFNPHRLADLLDFVSIHFYPVLGDPATPALLKANEEYLQAVLHFADVGKPVVLEEFGWPPGTWNERVLQVTEGLASGWLSWPFADSPASTDLSKTAGLVTVDGRVKEWGRTFQAYVAARTKAPPPRRDDLRPVDIDWRTVLTTSNPYVYLEDYLVAAGLK